MWAPDPYSTETASFRLDPAPAYDLDYAETETPFLTETP